MKLKDFIKQLEGLDPELEVGIFEGGDLFKEISAVQIDKIVRVSDDMCVKAWPHSEYYKDVIIIAQ